MTRRELLEAITLIPAVATAKPARPTHKVTLLSGMIEKRWETTGEVVAQRSMGSVEASFRQVRGDGSTGRVRVCGMGAVVIEELPTRS
ncbi:MAG: hypothetical protein K2Y37_26010 [Pirellulales bacterium]|nr:hypothetical protein [Pirellulales bacterium]